jgi:hypothetical protein
MRTIGAPEPFSRTFRQRRLQKTAISGGTRHRHEVSPLRAVLTSKHSFWSKEGKASTPGPRRALMSGLALSPWT